MSETTVRDNTQYPGYPAEIFGVHIDNAAVLAHQVEAMGTAFGRYLPVDSYAVRRAARSMVRAQSYLPYLEVLGGYENPRQQFAAELEVVARGVGNCAVGAVYNAPPDAAPQYAPTAESVARAVKRVARGLIVPDDHPEAFTDAPMLRQMAVTYLAQRGISAEQAERRLPKEARLAVVAPEILAALGYKDDSRFMQSVRANPSSFRWALRLPGLRQRRAAIETNGPALLQALRYTLPASGTTAQEAHTLLKALLGKAIPHPERIWHYSYD